MKASSRCSLLFSLLLIVIPHAAQAAPESKGEQPAPLSRKEAALVTITASVEAIDYKTREVTLKGPLGNSVSFIADERVKRFDEVKVGDLVQADYYVSIAAELRKPTAEEQKHPLVIQQAAGKAPPSDQPAAGAVRRFKVVTTVEGLDRPTQSVTVKGPQGRYLTARVQDPARLTQMRIGDNIVITYTEAVAISLEKVEKKSAN